MQIDTMKYKHRLHMLRYIYLLLALCAFTECVHSQAIYLFRLENAARAPICGVPGAPTGQQLGLTNFDIEYTNNSGFGPNSPENNGSFSQRITLPPGLVFTSSSKVDVFGSSPCNWYGLGRPCVWDDAANKYTNPNVPKLYTSAGSRTGTISGAVIGYRTTLAWLSIVNIGVVQSTAPNAYTLSASNFDNAGGRVGLLWNGSTNFAPTAQGSASYCPVPGPTISLSKALGGSRASSTDQFTVKILQDTTITASSTTTGSGNFVSGGSTGSVSVSAGKTYSLSEVMAPGSTSVLSDYNRSLTCSNANGATLPSALDLPFTVQEKDNIVCTITNTPKPATLAIRQIVLSPIPVNLVPPFTFNYAGDNGWGSQKLTTTSMNTPLAGTSQPLTTLNTATTLSVTYPEARWSVFSFSCVDTNAPASGNPTGTLVSATASSVTVPAANVRPGAALRCTALLRHSVP